MPDNFEFEARNPQGQVVTGMISADDLARAEKILTHNKLTVTNIHKKQELLGFLETITNRISLRDKLLFCKQLATMIEAGFPILQALEVIETQTTNRSLKDRVSQISADLQQGHSFSSTIEKQGDIFSPVFINAVKAGEASGKLPYVLRKLADNMEQDYTFMSKIKSAVAYPIFLLVAMVGIGIIMLVKVIPQLEQIFKESDVELPWPTKFFIWVSNVFQHYWWIILELLFLAYLAIRAWRKTESGKFTIDVMMIKAPILGPVMNLIYMSRFCRTFAILMSTGIPLLESIKIVSEAISNAVFKQALDEVYAQVEKGIPASTPLAKNKIFPPMIPNMMSVGEKTGKLDEILESLANYYELEVDNQMKKLSSLLEPVLIVIIGIGVAVMVFSIIMPIYNLAQVI